MVNNCQTEIKIHYRVRSGFHSNRERGIWCNERGPEASGRSTTPSKKISQRNQRERTTQRADAKAWKECKAHGGCCATTEKQRVMDKQNQWIHSSWKVLEGLWRSEIWAHMQAHVPVHVHTPAVVIWYFCLPSTSALSHPCDQEGAGDVAQWYRDCPACSRHGFNP